jgi:hypothetical protein
VKILKILFDEHLRYFNQQMNASGSIFKALSQARMDQDIVQDIVIVLPKRRWKRRLVALHSRKEACLSETAMESGKARSHDLIPGCLGEKESVA